MSRSHTAALYHEHDLGLRSARPPDSTGAEPNTNTNHSPEPHRPSLTDQDWEIRTGRAIYVLQHTLPEFFHAGLVTSIDRSTGTPRSKATVQPRSKSSSASTSINSKANFNFNSNPIPIINANPLDTQVVDEKEDGDMSTSDTEGIYDSKVSLVYTPPVQLPPPFPSTLHIEGLPLYLASSVFIRHTLNALYVDLNLELKKIVVMTPPSGLGRSSSMSSSSARDIPGSITEPGQRQSNMKYGALKSREKSVVIAFTVTGVSRVSGAVGESSTYTFSPISGLIYKHVVDEIYPAPHQAVYDSLRGSLGKVFGFAGAGEGEMKQGEVRAKPSQDGAQRRAGVA
ncbi:hypothetical protein H0H93_015479 [Arthromyces matolae]|nr:hypothetical protein H0H93_015479 [Arthromyces matolae]